MIFQKHYSIKQRSNHRGLLLVDILIAIALSALLIVAVIQLADSSREMYEFAKEKNRLIHIYEYYADQFEGMMPYQSRSYIVEPNNPYYLHVGTTSVSAYTYWYGNDRTQTDIIVSSGRNNIRFSVVAADPLHIPDSVGTPLCLPNLTQHKVVGSHEFDIGSQPNAQTIQAIIRPILIPVDPTIPLTSFQIRNGIAYLSSDSARQSDPDILIVDFRNTLSPSLLSGINTGPGISSIALASNYIFAAVTSRVAQLQVIGIQSLANLSVVANYKLPLPIASATPPLGSSIFYDKHLVYLGTEKWDGDEFSIIDVSDPLRPVKLGGIETGSKINSIYVRNAVAYVAASDSNQLRVIDVHDSAHPFIVDSFSPSGWERQEGKSLSYFEDRLNFGRTSGGFNIKQDQELFTWGSTTRARVDGISQPDNSQDVSGGIYGIVTDRSYLYAISHDVGRELSVNDFNLSTSTARRFSLPHQPSAMTCDGSSIYILATDTPVMYSVTF
jgi:hypothetical protein